MDKERWLYRAAGGAWLAGCALLLWMGESKSLFDFYAISVLPVLAAVELVLGLLIGIARLWWAALSTMLLGPAIVTLGYVLADSYDSGPNADGSLFLPLVVVPVLATLLSLAAGILPTRVRSSNSHDETH